MRRFHLLALLAALALPALVWSAWTPTSAQSEATHYKLIEVTGTGTPTADTRDRALLRFTSADGVKYVVIFDDTAGALAIVSDSAGGAVTTSSTSSTTSTSTSTSTTTTT